MKKVPWALVQSLAKEAEDMQNRLNALQTEAHKHGILLVMDVHEADGMLPTIIVTTQLNPAIIELPGLAPQADPAAAPTVAAKSSRSFIGQKQPPEPLPADEPRTA